jgi:hypothetical protein
MPFGWTSRETFKHWWTFRGWQATVRIDITRSQDPLKGRSLLKVIDKTLEF